MCLLTGKLLMCTFLPGGERPFLLVGGVGISVVFVATFMRTSQYNTHNHQLVSIETQTRPPCHDAPRVAHATV